MTTYTTQCQKYYREIVIGNLATVKLHSYYVILTFELESSNIQNYAIACLKSAQKEFTKLCFLNITLPSLQQQVSMI